MGEDMVCNECGGIEFKKVWHEEYGGSRNKPREKDIYICEGCGKEGRVFSGGTDGAVIQSGVLR